MKKFGDFHGCSRFSLWKTGDFAGKSMELARIEINNTRRRDGFSGAGCSLLEMRLSRGKDGGPTSRTAKLGEPNHQIITNNNLYLYIEPPWEELCGSQPLPFTVSHSPLKERNMTYRRPSHSCLPLLWFIFV